MIWHTIALFQAKEYLSLPDAFYRYHLLNLRKYLEELIEQIVDKYLQLKDYDVFHTLYFVLVEVYFATHYAVKPLHLADEGAILSDDF